MIVSLISAVSSNGVIGLNNQLPWKLPEDLAWFKKNTLNKTIVMGRKTWESLPFRPLPGRDHIVISRNSDYPLLTHKGILAPRTVLAPSIEEAIRLAKIKLRQNKTALTEESLSCADAPHVADEIMIIGGALIYEQSLPLCQRLYLTQIKVDYDGDAYFPDYRIDQWKQIFIEQHKRTDKNGLAFDYDFVILDKED